MIIYPNLRNKIEFLSMSSETLGIVSSMSLIESSRLELSAGGVSSSRFSSVLVYS